LFSQAGRFFSNDVMSFTCSIFQFLPKGQDYSQQELVDLFLAPGLLWAPKWLKKGRSYLL
jgi:hypothetical protein